MHTLEIDIAELKVLIDALADEKPLIEKSLEHTLKHPEYPHAEGNAQYLRETLERIEALQKKLFEI